MKNDEWKIRQEIYHKLNTEYDDDLNTKEVEITTNIVENAINYFIKRDIGWIYPSKSYMVGICYARWLAEHFGGRPVEYLEDPKLLYNNDPYFVQYSTDPRTYHMILNQIGGWNFDESRGMVPDVKQYFNDEFMINDTQSLAN
jgi:hypothetical protein